MVKNEEYGVPWLWKRVPVGTWVKDVSWLSDYYGWTKNKLVLNFLNSKNKKKRKIIYGI